MEEEEAVSMRRDEPRVFVAVMKLSFDAGTGIEDEVEVDGGGDDDDDGGGEEGE